VSELRKNTIQLTVASVGQKALAFLYFMFVARMIGTESTGEYFLALSITTMFSVITDFGLQPVLIRELAKNKEGWRQLVRNMLTVKLAFMFLSVLLVLCFVEVMGYGSDVKTLVYIALAVMSVDAVTLTMYGMLRGVQILLYESVGMFVGQSITIVCGVIALIFHLPIVYLIVALFCGSLFNAFFSTAMVLKKFKDANLLVPLWSWTAAKSMLKVALPFALAGIFVKVYSYVDTMMISKFFGEYEVGIYAVAYKLTYAFQFLPMAFVAALYPALSALIQTRDSRLPKIFEQSMMYMMFLATPIVFGIWAIAEPLISLSVGEEFFASSSVLSVLIFVLFFLFLDFPIGSLLNAADRQGLKTSLMFITMLINIVANFVFIPNYGVMGAAISANISFAFLFFSGLYFVPRFVKVKWNTLVWRAIRILFAGALMAVASRLVLQEAGIAIAIITGAVCYPLLLIVFKTIGWNDFRRV
jgi:O-antigen/teichoic acid export membrane protein